MIGEMVVVTALGVLLATIWDPSSPARFEPLFRQRWETAGTAAAARDYGVFLSRTGDRERAAMMLRKALELEESAETLEALATVVSPKEALPLYDRAIALHPTGNLYRKTGELLTAGGDVQGGEKRYRAALASYEKELGTVHPKVAVVLNDIGMLLESREDFQGAEALYRRALAIQSKVLGSTHPEVGTTLNNLGGAVGASGKLDAAEPLLRQALRVLEQTLGPRHSRAAACAGNLADLLTALGRPTEARTLYARAIAIYDALGDEDSARQVREALGKLP